jgi:hypothetical protein
MKQFILLTFLFCIVGCESYYYMPTMQNVPLFKEKKEIYASFGLDEHSMACFQGAYSISNHIGTQLTYMSRNKYDDYLVEAGIGYYLRYAQYFAFETYAGYGHGIVDNNSSILTLGLNRLYLQPSIGFTSKFFDFAFTPRFTKVDYKLKFNGTISSQYAYQYDIYNMDKHSFYFYEPGITIRIGYKYVKLQYQLIQAKKSDTYTLKYLNTNNSFSLLINIPLSRNKNNVK